MIMVRVDTTKETHRVHVHVDNMINVFVHTL